MLQNRVWTADRLLRRQWPNQYFCPPCIRNLETIAHLDFLGQAHAQKDITIAFL
jgi:hypothetical protein